MARVVAQAWQSWKSAKASALLIVVALTVGIGSSTAIYTVINTLLLRPVPYAHGERFVSLLGGTLVEPKSRSSLTLADVLEFQRRSRSFDLFGWLKFANYNLTAPGVPLYLNAVLVTPELVNNLGVNPRLGQWFRDAATPAAVISHGLWLHLGADPAIVGRTVTLNGRIYTVTGVMPAGFQLPLAGYYGGSQNDVWLPLDPLGRGQEATGLFVYARLRPGITVAQADAEVRQIAADIAQREPASHHSYTARVDDLRELITKEIRPVLLLLFGAAEVLLLITCANIGGLLLARSVARARETAVRVALGAGLPQLARQYFLEGLMVAIPGAAGGLALAAVLVRLLVSLGGTSGVRASEIAIDWRVVIFAAGTALLAGALAGIAPLWQAARTLPNDVLNEGVRASAGARTRRISHAFVISQVALAFVLLAVSAVLVTELYQVLRISPGFDPEHLLTFRLAFSPETIPGKPNRLQYQQRLVQALAAIPGVRGAAFVNQLPLDGCCYSTAIFPEGAGASPSTAERVSFLPVNTSYWGTMQIPLRRGRLLNEHDISEKLLPVVVNEATVRRYWPRQDPVGAFGHFNHLNGDRFQIVGVVGDVKNNGLDNPTVPEIYLPATLVPVNPMNFVVRSALPAKTLVPDVRRAIQSVNAGQPIHDVRMMTEIVAQSVVLKREASYVTAFFALAALLMATVGAYGVVSYSVRQRTVEFGTRMALGAGSRDLLRLVVGSGLKMAAYGVLIGGVASIAAAWLLVRQYEIRSLGFAPFLLSAAIVAAVAAGSSFFPAWRASLVSPLVAIRNEPGSVWQVLERVSRQDEPDIPPDGTLMTALIDASRGAASFRDAVRAALQSLRTHTGAESALLLETVSSAEYRSTAAIPEQAPGTVCIPARGLLMGRLRFHPSPLQIAAADFEVWSRWALEYKPEHLPEIEALRAAGSRLAIPLRTQKELLGVLLLGAPGGRDTYNRAERRLLRASADQFALLLENARLAERVMEQEKLQRDLALAAEVQKRLLPRQSLETRAASFAAVSIPARSIGGDYCDILDLGDDRTGVALADVAGKGVAAALIMCVVQASLRVIAMERNMPLPALAAKMNHFLFRSTGPNSYATFFYGQLDERSREFRYVNAGHNPPYLLRRDGVSPQLEELSTGGTIIGMFAQTNYDEGATYLEPGDVLMIFSDGVTEALNPDGDEFGEERLKGLLRQVSNLPVEEMSARISRELKAWMQDAAQHDDLTFVMMKVK